MGKNINTERGKMWKGGRWTGQNSLGLNYALKYIKNIGRILKNNIKILVSNHTINGCNK